MADGTCDKGPVLEQIIQRVNEMHGSQKEMTQAVVEIAKHQERIISLADKTTENANNIDRLYEQGRQVDIRLTEHLIKHPSPETCTAVPSLISLNADGKFDKVQVVVITTVVIALGGSIYDVLQSLVQAAQSLTVGG